MSLYPTDGQLETAKRAIDTARYALAARALWLAADRFDDTVWFSKDYSAEVWIGITKIVDVYRASFDSAARARDLAQIDFIDVMGGYKPGGYVNGGNYLKYAFQICNTYRREQRNDW